MKKSILLALAFAFTTAYAEETVDMNEFGSEETIETGVLNEIITNAIANEPKDEVEYGAKVTKYQSTPKFGGYFIGKYAYNTDEALNQKQGFSQRLIRVYVDGKIFNDFAYRIQLQVNNGACHTKDFYLEWQKYPEFKVKIGQFKRAFTFENPMNPWDVGVGDYSQLVKKLSGMGDDWTGEAASNGGRDQGIQVQGDLFKMNDGHKLVHYQVMVANGQGINVADANAHKDLMGTIQFQPIKGLFLGAFGWNGKYTNGTDVKTRKRWVASAKYDANDWTVRAEYGKCNDDQEGTKAEYKADAWYATVGIPCAPWLKTYVKWDVYRKDGTGDSAKSIYSIAPNVRLHKNLMFQFQYNYVDDKLAAKKYSELWLETYVRF